MYCRVNNRSAEYRANMDEYQSKIRESVAFLLDCDAIFIKNFRVDIGNFNLFGVLLARLDRPVSGLRARDVWGIAPACPCAHQHKIPPKTLVSRG